MARNTIIQTRSADFCPIYNYIGRSQFAADPLLKGMVDDVRIYNYSLSVDDIAQIAALTDGVATLRDTKKAAQGIYTLDGVRVNPSQIQRGRVYVIGNRKVRF